MATERRAHLTGLHVANEPLLPLVPDTATGPIFLELEQDLDASRQQAERAFREVVERAGIPFTWQALRGREVELAAVRARTADLAIVGQTDPDDPETFIAEGFPESVVLGSGRPTLFLPYAGSFTSAFRHVLVAWNGSREAARALADALPLLASADKVTVMTVESEAEERRPSDIHGVAVASYLSRHGVKAELTFDRGVTIAAGEWLLSRAADLGADLLVAGAYGHSRVREFVLGGVTRTLLHAMMVPVLMSH